MWPWDPELGSVSESLLVVLNLIDLYEREYGTFVGQKFETVQKNKQTNRTRCQLWMDLSGAFWVLRYTALICGPCCMPFRQAIIQTQAVNILGPSYCSLTLKEMGHIPETHFLNFLTLPGCWPPCCWSKIHSTLLSTWACIALGSFKKHPGLLTLVLLVFSLSLLVISLGHFECSLWELSGHRFLRQYSCWC